jgi:hypothetical protein
MCERDLRKAGQGEDLLVDKQSMQYIEPQDAVCKLQFSYTLANLPTALTRI